MVEPVARPLRARLEVRGVRATRDVDDRPLRPGDEIDLAPVAPLGDRVLRVDRAIRGLRVEMNLDHLPVALVQPGLYEGADQVVVVVEVEEPVLQPDVAAIAHRMPVYAVGVAGLRMQVTRLLRVLARRVADAVRLRSRAPARILLAQERQGEPVAGDRQLVPVLRDQAVSWVIGPLGGR